MPFPKHPHAVLGNPTLNLLDALCNETRVLQQWLEVERHCIMNKTEQLLSEDNAWRSKYDDDVFMVRHSASQECKYRYF